MATLEQASLTNFSRNAMVEHVFGVASYTPATTIYLALLTQMPDNDDDGSSISESGAGGYARTAITFGAPVAHAGITTNIRITQNATVTFPILTSEMTGIVAWGILDSATIGAGNLLAWGQLASYTVDAGEAPAIESGQIWIEIEDGMSNYMATAMLNMLFRGVSYTQPTIYIGLATAAIAETDTGSTVSEPSGGAYARQAVSGWIADDSNGQGVKNSATVTFAEESAASGGEDIYGVFAADALTGGNILYYDPWLGGNAKTLQRHMQVDFDAGNIVWRHENT